MSSTTTDADQVYRDLRRVPRGMKRCGVLRAGVPCTTLIPTTAYACSQCHEALVHELERMAEQ